MRDYHLELENAINRLRARELELIQKEWIGKVEGYPLPSLSWRYKKYLVMVWFVNGRRVERYIGADPCRVGVAMRGLLVQKELVHVREALQRLELIKRENEVQTLLFTMRIKEGLQGIQKNTTCKLDNY